MEFDELIARLPTVERMNVIDPRVGLRYVEASKSYISPTINVTVDPAKSAVVLVVAPAAVGKSSTANEIAARTGAAIWDLSTTLVGHNTFVGGLAQAFGPGELAQVVGGLRSGRSLVVLDALDETHLRSGYQNLEAFMGDIAGLVKGATSPVLVILARVETAVVAELMLSMAGVAVAKVRLEYFDERAARRFIDRRLTHYWERRDKSPVHHRNPAGYRAAVDAIFEFVYSSLGGAHEDPWESESVRTFLGYAPALEAIADYLAVDNFQSVLGDIEATNRQIAAEEAGTWLFLRHVVESIVERERVKVLAQVRPMLASLADEQSWDDWDVLYSEPEQIDRVLRRFFRVGLFSDQMHVIPTKVRDGYEAVLAPVADQHPFLADARQFSNVVFKEYALAWALTRSGASVRTQVLRLVRDASYLATPLLARFMLFMADRDPDSERPLIEPTQVGLVFDSLAASAETDGEFLFLVVADSETTALARVARNADDRKETAFTVASSGDPIFFPRRLAHAEISVLGGVTLGRPGTSFSLGPDVLILTDILETPAAEYVVLGSADDFGVRMEADTHIDGDTPPLLKNYAESPLVCSWDGIVHPWYPYGDDEDVADESPELSAAFHNLISILTRFRKHGRDEFAKSKDMIDNVVVGRYVSDRTADARRLLQFLLETEVLRDSRGLYFANLDPLGMSWTDVRNRVMPDQTRTFLGRFLESNSSQ